MTDEQMLYRCTLSAPRKIKCIICVFTMYNALPSLHQSKTFLFPLDACRWIFSISDTRRPVVSTVVSYEGNLRRAASVCSVVNCAE